MSLSQIETKIRNDMRKWLRYSYLTKISMELLKQHNLYLQSDIIVKQESINTQKNYVIIFFRLSFFQQKMQKEGWANNVIAKEIYLFIKNNLPQYLEKRAKIYFEKLQTPGERTEQSKDKIKGLIKAKIQHDIQTIHYVFMTKDRNIILNRLSQLYNLHNDKERLNKCKEKIMQILERHRSKTQININKECTDSITNDLAHEKIEIFINQQDHIPSQKKSKKKKTKTYQKKMKKKELLKEKDEQEHYQNKIKDFIQNKQNNSPVQLKSQEQIQAMYQLYQNKIKDDYRPNIEIG